MCQCPWRLECGSEHLRRRLRCQGGRPLLAARHVLFHEHHELPIFVLRPRTLPDLSAPPLLQPSPQDRHVCVCVCAFNQPHLHMVLLLERLCLTAHGVTMDGSLRVPEHHTSSDLRIRWPAHARKRAAHPRRRPHQVRNPGVSPESRQRSFLPDSETACTSSGQPASLTCKRARSSCASSCQNSPDRP